MNCIDEGKLLAFLDDELSSTEKILIREHIEHCAKCAGNLRLLQQRKENLMSLMNENIARDYSVPPFKPKATKPFISNKKRQYQKIVFYVAAAAILILMLLVLKPKTTDDYIIYSYDLTSEFDANLPITKQEMTIHIYSNNDFSENK
ncbi:MAG: zf-HC2 domain-containing protein [Bacteroidales bacterium]|nr:zf-HC2 domain-containing protein [Bacteroidales bacterium]